jgi:hypothetical protein
MPSVEVCDGGETTPRAPNGMATRTWNHTCTCLGVRLAS